MSVPAELVSAAHLLGWGCWALATVAAFVCATELGDLRRLRSPYLRRSALRLGIANGVASAMLWGFGLALACLG